MEADDGYWDEVAVQADALPDGWRRHARTAHLELLGRWVGAPAGRWLKTDLFEERTDVRALLPALGSASWVGADVAPATVAASGVWPAVAADVRRLPFADGAFDGVLSTSTLDHFPERRSIELALVELRRVLARSGHLVLTLDNPENPLVRLRNALPRRVARRTGLVPFAVGETLGRDDGVQALEAAGFDVQACEAVLHVPHVLGTRLGRWGWWERQALPAFDRLGGTRAGRFSGHFIAFLARPH